MYFIFKFGYIPKGLYSALLLKEISTVYMATTIESSQSQCKSSQCKNINVAFDYHGNKNFKFIKVRVGSTEILARLIFIVSEPEVIQI